MKKQVKTNMKSIIAVALASAILIGGTASIGYFSKGFKDWNVKNWFTTNDHVKSDSLATQLKGENGIKLKVKNLASANNYGSQIISYSVDPSFNTDTILYKVAYNDASSIEEGVLSIKHDNSNNQITITCLKAFTKQIILTLYAESNENINASINIDFVEKLTPTFTLQAETGKQLKVNTNVATTGGSITVDKTIKEETFTFNTDFVTKVNSYMKEDSLNYFKKHTFLGTDTDDSGTKYYFSEKYSYIGESYNPSETTIDDYYKDTTFASILSSLSPNSITSYSTEAFINAIYTQFIKIWYNLFDKEDNNMSKRYDEYVNKMNNNFSTEVIPMIPNIDSKLEREIRDRAIIALVKMSISKGMELTYGDICLTIDNDPSEKEYENMKTEITPKTK